MLQKLKLYEVDTGGCTYWVASCTDDPKEIQKLIKNNKDVLKSLWHGQIPANCIHELSREEADINIWLKFCATSEAKLLGCEQLTVNSY
jgi:hypothetical protein